MELETTKRKFSERGLGVCAISYDNVTILKNFSDRKNITYPLISDTDSKIIRAFGIFNTTMQPGSVGYGVPYPGYYVVDHHGTVRAKYFEDAHQERFTAGDILVRQFSDETGVGMTAIETPHLRLSYSSSDAEVSPGQRIALLTEITLKKKMHVYAPQVKDEYTPISWSMEPARSSVDLGVNFPEPSILYLRPIQEKVPVYEGKLKLVREIRLAEEKTLRDLVGTSGQVEIKGTLKYQACDDRVCYPPETIPMTWKLKIRFLDRERAPAEVQHKSTAP